LTCAGLAGLAHVADPSGFVHNADILRQMEKARHPRVPDRISPSDLMALGTRVLIVDARTQAQFNGTRIPGAVNIPITSSHRRNLGKLKGISLDTRIVLYCNSENCPWAEALAKSSLFQDFDSVSVLDGGIEGYEAGGGQLVDGPPQRNEIK
jgi:rhodanese-related sulfurtransferase